MGSFYNLSPIGVGTPNIESLSDFIARLANAHQVSSLVVLRYLLSKNDLKPMHLSTRTYSINGMGKMAQRFVDIFEKELPSKYLKWSTFLPYKDVIAKTLPLLKKHRAVCPLCLNDWKTKHRQIYEPLIWSLAFIDVCPSHFVRLIDNCYVCGYQLVHFSEFHKPGCCPRCNTFLGENLSLVEYCEDKKEQDLVRWTFLNFGDLFVASYNKRWLPEKETLMKNLGLLYDAGVMKKLPLEELNKTRTSIWKIRNSDILPSLEFLLPLCYILDIRLIDLFTNLPQKELSYRELSIPTFWSLRSRENRDLNKNHMKNILLKAINENPPPTLTEISERENIETKTFRTNFPILSKKVSGNYLKKRVSDRENHLVKGKKQLRDIMDNFNAAGIYPSYTKVFSLLDTPLLESYDEMREEWHDQLVELGWR